MCESVGSRSAPLSESNEMAVIQMSHFIHKNGSGQSQPGGRGDMNHYLQV